MKKLVLLSFLILSVVIYFTNGQIKAASSPVSLNPADGQTLVRDGNDFLITYATMTWSQISGDEVFYTLDIVSPYSQIINETISRPSQGHFCPPVNQTPAADYEHRVEWAPNTWEIAQFTLVRMVPE